jgi:uncharacterized protein YqjF (DUF2071 family)
MLAVAGEPLFLATWARTVFIHYEADAALLQRQIPFQLDLYEGRAFVSIVAFTLLRMRPRVGGRLSEWLFKPIASHDFLNVRTYVRKAGEPGIFFLAEWLSNSLSVRLGPRTFGLPYRFGHLSYAHNHADGEIFGTVTANDGWVRYRASIASTGFHPSEAGSLTEFLCERYTAFTCQRERRRLFRVWHEPWPQTQIELEMTSADLLASTGLGGQAPNAWAQTTRRALRFGWAAHIGSATNSGPRVRPAPPTARKAGRPRGARSPIPPRSLRNQTRA